MAKTVIQKCDCCDTYFFERTFNAIDANEGDALLQYVYENVDDKWCGEVALVRCDEQIIGYQYMTTYIDELQDVKEIAAEIDSLIETFVKAKGVSIH